MLMAVWRFPRSCSRTWVACERSSRADPFPQSRRYTAPGSMLEYGYLRGAVGAVGLFPAGLGRESGGRTGTPPRILPSVLPRQRQRQQTTTRGSDISPPRAGSMGMETTLRWTSADLEVLPDNGKHYEIIDGEI